MANKIPAVSRQVVREFLIKGDKNLLRKFLVERGGKVAVSGFEEDVKALINFAEKSGRKLNIGDARVAASAIREQAAIITNDTRFFKFLNQLGVKNFQF